MTLKKKQWLLILTVGFMSAPVFAAEKKAAMSPEMMQKWAAYSTPSEGHKALEPLVGSWSHTMKFWMAPDSKPEISTGTTESKWILGGRFVEAMVTGTSMGQPFEGRGISGFDNEKKQYTSIWIDNMATGMMISNGTYDTASKKLTENGTASCPFEGTKNFRGVTKITDNNTHTYEMYGPAPDGKEFKMMEIKYTRNK